MNVTDEHFARIFRETYGGRNKARCLPKGCTPITRMNKLRKRFTQAVFTNTLREKALRSAKKRFFRQHIAVYHIESRAFHVKQRKKQEKPALWMCGAKRLPCTTWIVPRRSAPSTICQRTQSPVDGVFWPLFDGTFWSLFAECSEHSLLAYSSRSLTVRSEESLLTYSDRSSLVRFDCSSWICATLPLLCHSKQIRRQCAHEVPYSAVLW